MGKADFLIIAHRGESHDAPENTLASINLAWERGADAVEIDIHLSKDLKPVVIHDDNTFMLNGKHKKVKDLTLKELKALDAGKYKGEQWANASIPTLEEVLKTVPPAKKLFIEIKSGIEILPELKKTLLKANCSNHQIKLIGFGLNTLSAAKKMLPLYDVYFIFKLEYDRSTNILSPKISEMISAAYHAGVDGLNVSASEAIDGSFVDKVNAAGLKFYVWTVNDPVEARRLKNAGVDGVTTDRAQWLKLKLNETGH